MKIYVEANVVVHQHEGADNTEVLAAIEELKVLLMSALTDAVARVATAYSDLKVLLEEALATDPAQEAELADLRARVAASDADAAEAIAALANIAPDPGEPPVEPPVV